MLLSQTLHFCFIAITLYTRLIIAQQPQNPVCNVCANDPDATIGNPNGNVTIPPEFMSPFPTLTCQQIYDAGLQGLIPADACTIVTTDVRFQEGCQCSNFEPPAATPVATPTPVAPVPEPTPGTSTPSPDAVPPPVAAPTDPPAGTPVPAPVPEPTDGTPVPAPVPEPTDGTPTASETPVPAPSDSEPPSTCDEGKGKGGMGMMGKGSDSGKGKGGSGEGKGDSGEGKGDSGKGKGDSGKGKGGGMMMGGTKSCKEPKTPKAGMSAKKEKEGKGKGSSRLRA